MQAAKIAKLQDFPLAAQFLPADVLIHILKLSITQWGMSVVAKARQVSVGWRFACEQLMHQLVQESVYVGTHS
jgi:hypothetical protein